jgi:multiple sugar transport system permease protein
VSTLAAASRGAGRPSGRTLTTALALFVLLSYLVPLAFVSLAAFKSNAQIANDPAALIFHPSLAGFRAVLNRDLVQALWNSAQIAVGATAVTMIVGTPLAYVLARTHSRWNALVIGVLIALQMTPTATAVIPLFRVLVALHLLNHLGGVALAIAATTLPYAVLLLRPYFLSVPVEVEEAARIDGAGEFTCFLRVVLPLVRNGLSLIAVLLLIGSWGEFLYSVSFLTSSSKYPLSVLLVEQEGFYGTQYNNLMALALISSVPVVILFTVVARRLTSGLTLGVGK